LYKNYKEASRLRGQAQLTETRFSVGYDPSPIAAIIAAARLAPRSQPPTAPTRNDYTPEPLKFFIGHDPTQVPCGPGRGLPIIPFEDGPRILLGMDGLGDNLYQRGIVRYYPGSWLRTPFPWLYDDMDLQFIRPNTSLRTQAKAVAATVTGWGNPPNLRAQKILYRQEHMAQYGMPGSMKLCVGVPADKPFIMDLPPSIEPAPKLGEKVAIIRPVTVRAEWANPSRNPDPQYIAHAAAILRERGYTIVSLADLEEGKEWMLPPYPVSDFQFHHGEKSFRGMLALIKSADVCVGGVGWLSPAIWASGTPGFTIAGGCGGYNGPEQVAPGSPTHMGWALPDDFCRCYDLNHNCNKHITDFDGKFIRWLDATLGMDAGRLRTSETARRRNRRAI
jgi:hypothetical protein